MKLFRAAPAVLGMAFLSAAFSPSVKADDYDHQTTVTFSAPVEIPGVHLQGWGVLPPGTYVFRLLDSGSDRHIVQIFSKDQLTVYATILAIPNYRLQATDKTAITFNEGVRGKPEALRAWFYPGANWGEEFVYPKARAEELAAVTKLPVPATVAEFQAEAVKPDEPAVATQLKQAPVMAVKPTGEVVELAQVIQVTPPESVLTEPAPTQVAVNTLPATASSLPLIALCGLLALGGAFTIRSIRNRAL